MCTNQNNKNYPSNLSSHLTHAQRSRISTRTKKQWLRLSIDVAVCMKLMYNPKQLFVAAIFARCTEAASRSAGRSVCVQLVGLVGALVPSCQSVRTMSLVVVLVVWGRVPLAVAAGAIPHSSS